MGVCITDALEKIYAPIALHSDTESLTHQLTDRKKSYFVTSFLLFQGGRSFSQIIRRRGPRKYGFLPPCGSGSHGAHEVAAHSRAGRFDTLTVEEILDIAKSVTRFAVNRRMDPCQIWDSGCGRGSISLQNDVKQVARNFEGGGGLIHPDGVLL